MNNPIVQGAYLNWSIGDKTLTSLSDGFNLIDYDIVHSVTPERGAELQKAAHRTAKPVFSHTMFLIRGGDHGPILIDAGMGTVAGPNLGWLPNSLAMAGVKSAEIELILMTHLHPDHCFGLIDGEGRAVFANAKLAMHRDEYDFWLTPVGELRAPDSLMPFFDMVRKSVEPYRDRIQLFEGGEVAPGVKAIPLPGHTPGHSGFTVSSGMQTIFIWADIIHMPAIQPAWPDAGVIHDVDPGTAAATRKRVFVEAADQDLLVAGCHLEFPAVARLVREDDAYRLVPELWPLVPAL